MSQGEVDALFAACDEGRSGVLGYKELCKKLRARAGARTS